MPDLKISQLPVASATTGAELFPVVQGGVTKQIALNNVQQVGTLTSLAVSGVLVVDTDTLYVDSVSNAVGIGTTTPLSSYLSKFAVVGNIAAALGGKLYQFDSTNSSGRYMQAVASSGLAIGKYNAGGDIEQVRIDASGNVGIGTASLKAYSGFTSLTIGNNGSGGVLAFRSAYNSGDGAEIYQNSAGTLFFNIRSTLTAATLDASGNLGLGVTPSAWATYPALQVSYASLWGAVNNAYLGANYYFDGTNRRYIASGFATEFAQVNGEHRWYTAASGTAGNAISFGDPKVTLDASGNLGVGTASPSARLQVDQANAKSPTAAWHTLVFDTTSATTGVGGGIILGGYKTSTSAGEFFAGIDGYKENATGGNAAGALRFHTQPSTGAGLVERARITSLGSVVTNTAALATSATDGFLYVPTCAGTPTGTPTTQTGTAPIIVDTTNHKLYFFSGGTWRDAGP